MYTLILLIWMAGISLPAFLLCAADKWKAKRGRWRVPEKTLLLLALFGGGWGLWLGMVAFRHKTKHLVFQVVAPLSAFCWTVGLLLLAVFC